MSDNPNLSVALRLATLGIPVFPCAPERYPFDEQGKKPRPGVMWKGAGATTDERQIRQAFQRWPDSIVAISPITNGWLVVDCDRKPGKPDGVATLNELAWANGDDPRDWPTIETPSGGRHVMFKDPGNLADTTSILPGIDIKCKGYIIAEGSTHLDGRSYKPEGDGYLAMIEMDAIPDMPGWLHQALLNAKAATKAHEPQPSSRSSAPPTSGESTTISDSRSDFFTRIKGEALRRLGEWVPIAFPKAIFQPGTGAWSISSRDLGRNLQERLSFHPEGVQDFGTEQASSPISALVDHGIVPDSLAAARWLCDRLAIDYDALWAETHPEPDIDLSRLKPKLKLVSVDETRIPASDADPVDIWGKFNPPALPAGLLPAAIEEFAHVQGEMMGADPGGLACAALAVCAAAIPDSIKLQVKQHDTSWTESARLWIALIGDPSTKKSPVLSQAVRPLLRLDAALYREYAQAMAEYEALLCRAVRKPSSEAPAFVRARAA
ncbi:bifunctional DNA primase/polymerase [Bosea sp. (in: a-proteobacteria)]|uniref:bifunctional DNA primase/polymerase n=1 Tax=Bosea sp. (in: a-proteobacteria) TaxID=1871050 RepID=UPI002602A722|nr:bifunctional DNA primase/polymerase [Bosea sp. (in: a-proteobacteria)]MCO5092713.1 bifunctional DNA primase/polymerase [Bosea sp. (in: a-proteobacteria)]